MGDIRLHSSLNQPFNAEIPIMDTEGISLEAIKANLASMEDYKRIGLQQSEILSFLKFSITKNAQGQPVISITSTERISEPYLQIVVDLAWPQGQIYRAYTILLDPPGYQLKKVTSVTEIKHLNVNKVSLDKPGVVDKPVYQHIQGSLKPTKAELTYGPTVANEDIWQIAQRYITSETTLQQVILAIVGTNSEAFTQGNLNGLKVGERLRIPTNDEIAKIPAKLAKEEVLAHDTAWKNKQEIKHVILPPYIDAVPGTTQFNKIDTTYYVSKIASIPKFSLEKPTSNATTSLPVPEVFLNPAITVTPFTKNQVSNLNAQKDDANIRAELGVTLAAIDSVRTENSLMKEQMNKLKAANTQLQQQINKQQQEITRLQEQLKVIIQQRPGIQSQAQALKPQENSTSWLYWLIIGGTAIVIAYGLLYWFWLRQRYYEVEDIEGENITPVVATNYLEDSQAQAETKSVATVNDVPAHTIASEMNESSETTDKMEPLTPQVMGVNLAKPSESQDAQEETKLVEKSRDELNDDNISESKQVGIDKSAENNEQTEPVIAEREDDLSSNVNKTMDNRKENQEKPADFNEVTVPARANSEVEKDDLGNKNINNLDTPSETSDKSDFKQTQDIADNHTLNFEPGLDKLIIPTPKSDMPQDDMALNFDLDDQLKGDKLPGLTASDATLAEPEGSEGQQTGQVEQGSDPDLSTLDLGLGQPDKENEEQANLNTNVASDGVKTAQSSEEQSNTSQEEQLVKSSAALDTLLSLAKTYISMEDFESAEQSLQEVIEFGNEAQKEEAQKLLQDLNDK